MYTVVNEKAFITGDIGRYDNLIKNNSVRYARNSVDSFKRYLSNYTQPPVDLSYDVIDFSHKSKIGFVNKISDFFKNKKFDKQMNKLEANIKTMEEQEKKRSPINFIQKYMPYTEDTGIVDKMALMGAAYEEMGATEKSVEELNALSCPIEGVDEDLQISADALDINQDGKVDLAEYSTSVLLEDALSSDTDELKHENINGVITKDGSDKSLAYYTKRNVEIARNVFSQIYDYYNLGEAKEEFLSDKNNLVQA